MHVHILKLLTVNKKKATISQLKTKQTPKSSPITINQKTKHKINTHLIIRSLSMCQKKQIRTLPLEAIKNKVSKKVGSKKTHPHVIF